LDNFLQLLGYPCLLALTCRNAVGALDDAYRTLMMQEMIVRGVLFQGLFYTTWSHREAELDRIAAAFDEACTTYSAAIKTGTCDGLLIGRPAKPVFRKKI
jgi:glutamate-1-semialdehyde 2,1-aminomutase